MEAGAAARDEGVTLFLLNMMSWGRCSALDPYNPGQTFPNAFCEASQAFWELGHILVWEVVGSENCCLAFPEGRRDGNCKEDEVQR